MDVAIRRVTNKKLFLDETEGIMKVYPELLEDPKTKIKRMSQKLKMKIVVPIILVVVLTVILFFIQNPIFFIGLGASAVSVIYEYLKYDEYNKSLELYKSKQIDIALNISEYRIHYIDNITNRTKTVEWEKIKQVLLTPNCICFMPEYVETQDMNAIIISREYEIEILETLKKIGKDKLIVLN